MGQFKLAAFNVWKLARIPFFVEDFDLNDAGLDTDQAFYPYQKLLYNNSFLRSLNLWDILVYTNTGPCERLIVVERLEESDGNHTMHRSVLDCYVVIPHRLKLFLSLLKFVVPFAQLLDSERFYCSVSTYIK